MSLFLSFLFVPFFMLTKQTRPFVCFLSPPCSLLCFCFHIPTASISSPPLFFLLSLSLSLYSDSLGTKSAQMARIHFHNTNLLRSLRFDAARDRASGFKVSR
uniref:Putative secreted protein n=1 Tax=Anopheles darlingi TaxID=43151 RepID=A0A2M4DG22_ANODA